jgi:acyl-CoA reductase-like NAD-dependent aldehyde dehydrogenase
VPTCLFNVGEDTALWRDWLPGPLLCVNTFSDDATPDEVAHRVNRSSRFGGKAFVFCDDAEKEEIYAARVDVGTVFLGGRTTAARFLETPLDLFQVAQQPRKISGDGAVIGGVECIEQYLRRKTIVKC